MNTTILIILVHLIINTIGLVLFTTYLSPFLKKLYLKLNQYEEFRLQKINLLNLMVFIIIFLIIPCFIANSILLVINNSLLEKSIAGVFIYGAMYVVFFFIISYKLKFFNYETNTVE